MQAETRRLGAAILEAEQDRCFAHRHIDTARLQAATATVAALLTPSPRAEYQK